MGWEDRPYYRDRQPSASNPLTWAMSGSVPLFEAFGIRVRAHASLVIACVLILLFGLGNFGTTWQERVEAVSILFAVVLMHEFGHCFAARWVGGSAEDILMTPLGGLAFAHPPRRWGPTFVTVAAGPAVNVLICLTAGAIFWSTTGIALPWIPFANNPLGHLPFEWISVARVALIFYEFSYTLFLFNALVPIWPLDCGQMLQAVLWSRIGYYRSMVATLTVGVIGSVVMFAVGLASRSPNLLFFGIILGLNCYLNRMQLLAAGPYEFADDDVDYSAAYEHPDRSARRRKPSRSSLRAADKAKRTAQAEVAEREQVDQILAKVSAVGMASLTRAERRVLKQATQHRRRQAEVG